MLLAAVLTTSALSVASPDSALTLASKGKSAYRIVVAKAAPGDELRAATELRDFLKQITGAELAIVTDDQRMSQHEIIVGNNRHTRRLHIRPHPAHLGEEGYLIRTVGSRLVIAGATPRATLYGVYGFLDDHLGYHWLSSEVQVVPRCRELTIGPIDDAQVPAFSYREVFYYDAMDPDFALRNRLNGNASIIKDGRMIRGIHSGWGYWVHTFATLVPPSVYFNQQPEYFALVDGKRIPNGQLCLTNPDVFRITVEHLKKKMAEDPSLRYWSVSQNDTFGNCQCPACRAIDEREGTPMGSLLEFVNKVAAEFPDKVIATLAYQYTRRPPKTLRPSDNVLIMLCSIECNRSRPIPTDPDSASFRSDMEGWASICDNLFVWDYVTQFTNLVSPFPNLRVLQPNMRFFAANHGRGMFPEGNYCGPCGEFAELRAYLLAKLIWNPDYDMGRAMDDFLTGYYGAAAPFIRAYVDRMHDALEQSGASLSIFGDPSDHARGYLAPRMVTEYEALFDQAEQAVADQPEVLLRVRAARMPLMYAQLKLGFGTRMHRESVAADFFATAEQTGPVRLAEWGFSVEEFRKQVAEALAKKH